MISIGVVLDILCFKYRRLSSGLFFYEIVLLVLTNCIYIDKGVYSTFVTSMTLLGYVLCLSCYQGTAILIATAVYFLIEFILNRNVEAEEAQNNLNYLNFHKVVFCMSLFVLSSLGFMGLNWVLQLASKLGSLQRD